MAGNVVGPLMAYEGLIAFFLESAFLGILLFGRKRVAPSMHFASAVLVALGTLFSSFWILATNSWMQTPMGHTVSEGRIYPSDWGQIIFSPSFPYRLSRTVVAFSVTAAFVVLGVGAFTLRRAQFIEAGRVMVRTALCLLVVLVPLQAYIGDRHGLNTLEYQPAKVAAMEGRWETQSPMPLTLFAIPDEQGESNKYEIDVPSLGSIILTHTFSGSIKGLKEFPRNERPPVAPVLFCVSNHGGFGNDHGGISRVKLAGIIPWVVWASTHILFLPRLQNPRRVQSPRLWSYFAGQRSSRLVDEAPRI